MSTDQKKSLLRELHQEVHRTPPVNTMNLSNADRRAWTDGRLEIAMMYRDMLESLGNPCDEDAVEYTPLCREEISNAVGVYPGCIERIEVSALRKVRTRLERDKIAKGSKSGQSAFDELSQEYTEHMLKCAEGDEDRRNGWQN